MKVVVVFKSSKKIEDEPKTVRNLRSLSYVNLHQKDAVKDQTIKVYLSTVKINERFGTAIAIWIFSI